MTDRQILDLAREVYRAAYDGTDSFELAHVGADLAYLLGAIINEERPGVEWPRSRPLLRVLRERLGHDHAVWRYIDITDS